ncbi:MAG: hypothetical protein IJ438_07485 [Clostridia bacterium]|nr:hypothetical protein [Clostridia bacterium]
MPLVPFILGAALIAGLIISQKRGGEQEPPVLSRDIPVSDDAAEDAPAELGEIPVMEIRCTIVDSCRAMDPVTLTGASRVTFRDEAGYERKLHIPGSNGALLYPGDAGVLTCQGDVFVSFEKPDGEIVGALYHIPAAAQEEEANE